MNLNSRKSVHPRWTTWGVGPLSAFATCTIGIYDPNNEDNGDNFDPYGPPVNNASILLWSGEAQMQVFRQTLNADDVAGSVTQLRSVRFTAPLDGPDMPVRKGLIVRVLQCDHDPAAEQYEYIVVSGLNSGLAWKRTIETEVDQAVLVTPIGE